jgi:hypothetical protein
MVADQAKVTVYGAVYYVTVLSIIHNEQTRRTVQLRIAKLITCNQNRVA